MMGHELTDTEWSLVGPLIEALQDGTEELERLQQTNADLLAALKEADRVLTIPLHDADDLIAIDTARREAITIARAAITSATQGEAE